ncbi:hypothetical protein IJI72_00585 [Candidatus Saccharibacteria bacterium]|nr:hypothetical protein [Candidatus Saccharibacteria bacterium]
MLKHLFKLDFLFINQYLPYFLLGAVVSLLITRLTADATITFWIVISNIFKNLTISCTLSFFINILARTVFRFRNNFYKDEAYLTHTLPVAKSSLYLSKVLAMLASVVLSSALLLALFYFLFPDFQDILKVNLDQSLASSLLIALIFLLEISYFHFATYVSILLGHRSSTHRTLRSVGCLICLYSLPQTFLLSIIYLLSRVSPDFSFIFEAATPDAFSLRSAYPLAFLVSGFYLLCGLLYGYLGYRLFRRGVDVE